MKLRTSLVVGSSILLLAASATPAAGQVPHTVQPGESLWSIAARRAVFAVNLRLSTAWPNSRQLTLRKVIMAKAVSE